jgi:hypothetical protein
MEKNLSIFLLSLILALPALAQEHQAGGSGHNKGFDLSNMTEEDLFYWKIQKDEPAFGHACAMALAGGNFEEKAEIEGLCAKVRKTPEVMEAIAAAENAMKSMNEERRERLLNGEAPIGAPKAAVYLAWGKPSDTRRAITKGVVAEKIIYDERIAYIENGILVMIQE